MANRYWVGGSGQWNASNTTNWSATSGGSGGASVPTSGDNVFFDANSFTAGGQTVEIFLKQAICKDFNIQEVTNNPSFEENSGELYVYGDINISETATFTMNDSVFDIYLMGTGKHIINIGGDRNTSSVISRILITGGFVVLAQDFSWPSLQTAVGLGEPSPSFDTKGFDMDVALIVLSNCEEVNLRDSVITIDETAIAGDDSILGDENQVTIADRAKILLDNTADGLTLENTKLGELEVESQSTSTVITMQDASIVALNLSGSVSFGTEGIELDMDNSFIETLSVNTAISGSAIAEVDITNCDDSFIERFTTTVDESDEVHLLVSTDALISELELLGECHVLIGGNNTLTVNNITRGDSNATAHIESQDNGVAAFLNITNNVISINKINFKDITVVGDGQLFAGANSTNESGNSNILFIPPPTQNAQKKIDFNITHVNEDGEQVAIDIKPKTISDVTITNAINELPLPINITLPLTDEIKNNRREIIGLSNIVVGYLNGGGEVGQKSIFRGRIENVQTNFKTREATLTVYNNSHILDKQLLFVDGTESADASGTVSGAIRSGENWYHIVEYTPSGGITEINQLKFRLHLNTYTYWSRWVRVTVHSTLADAKKYAGDDNPIAPEIIKGIWNTAPYDHSFIPEEPIPVTAGQTYYIRVWGNGSGSEHIVLSGEESGSSYFGPASSRSSKHDPDNIVSDTFTAVYSVITSNPATEVTYTDTDVADIIRSALDSSLGQGGEINYNAFTLRTTGKKITYTFNTATILEVVKKCMEYLTNDWYWYIDPATNLFYLRQADLNTAKHNLISDQSISDLEDEINSERLNTVLYFTGGDTGSGTLFKKYTNQDALTQYGHRAERIQDGRVTLEGTADKYADARFDKTTVPQFRLQGNVIDDAANPKGYNTESLKPGDSIRILGVDDGEVPRYDEVNFDEAYFDYDLYKTGSIIASIVRVEYTPLGTLLYIGSDLTRVNSILDSVKRIVGDMQTIDNPSEPLV